MRSSKGSDVALAKDIQLVMDVVSRHTQRFLEAEMELPLMNSIVRTDNVQQLELKDLTSLVAVGGGVNIIIAFTFEQGLIEEIFNRFTDDIEVPPDEKELYIKETASEVINTIIGNSTADIHGSQSPISLSPPMIIVGAKSVFRDKEAVFVTVESFFDSGVLQTYFIGPRELFDEKLDYMGDGGGQY